MGASATYYPAPAFYFRVAFSGSTAIDQAFQEVRGVAADMDVEEITEGGENRFVHRLPKSTKHPLLELKRAIAPRTSPLVTWCQSVLEGDLGQAIETKALVIMLLDPDGKPLMSWLVANAFPVKWEIDSFNSTKNEVAIETIALSYTTWKRLI
ncbi:MAG TPA: phage tail protein [Bryobacteraceae bacterium]|jgi:phage tail-like protein|nr:phage tail protein [Bryobacteraceae bacterium]